VSTTRAEDNFLPFNARETREGFLSPIPIAQRLEEWNKRLTLVFNESLKALSPQLGNPSPHSPIMCGNIIWGVNMVEYCKTKK
jgi:hypothetical protein